MSRNFYQRRNRGRGERKRFADHVKANAFHGDVESSPVLEAFECYRKELDAKHDKYERLIKLSRDITIESKRIIFLLHSINKASDFEKKIEEARGRIRNLIVKNFYYVAKELEGEDQYRYMRAFSAGIQEFIEAYSLLCYLENGELLPWENVRSEMVYKELKAQRAVEERQPEEVPEEKDGEKKEEKENDQPQESMENNAELKEVTDSDVSETDVRKVLITPMEYALGIEDLTGELMRHAINSLSSGKIDTMFQTCNFVRSMYIGFLGINRASNKEFYRKLTVLKQSLLKIEHACYVVQVRGSEIPKHLLANAVACQDSNVDDDEGIF